MSKPNLSLGSVLVKIVIVSAIMAALVSTTQSLMLYMGGGMFGASAPATTAAAVTSWVVSTVMLTVVQSFILSVGTFIFAVGYSVVAKGLEGLAEDKRATLRKVVKWAFTADVILSLLIGVYSGTAQYAIFSALKADPTLNLVTSILAGLITVIYCVPVFAFIGTVATFILGTFVAVLSGGMNKKNDAPKDGN